MIRRATAGMTLVEVLVSLVIFALVGGASFALLDQILQSRLQSEARLTRVQDVERAFRLLGLDTGFALPGSFRLRQERLDLQRSFVGGVIAVSWHFRDGNLVRSFGTQDQTLVSGLSDVTWQTLSAGEATVAGLDLRLRFAADGVATNRIFVLPGPLP